MDRENIFWKPIVTCFYMPHAKYFNSDLNQTLHQCQSLSDCQHDNVVFFQHRLNFSRLPLIDLVTSHKDLVKGYGKCYVNIFILFI